MRDDLHARMNPAYAYPLLIKHLLETGIAYAPDQEIVYRDSRRYTYRTLQERIKRLASGLTRLGVRAGDVVAVMDWDSDRYLECFFAIPMMGAVIQTVNVRLTPDQILYTLDHAEAKVLLVNAEFLPCLNQIKDRLQTVEIFVLIDETGAIETAIPFACEYAQLLSDDSPDFVFPDFDENARATTFYTTGTTGHPKGVYFSHRQLVLHTLSLLAMFGQQPSQGRFHRGDVYMPITPMFHVHAWGFPFAATMAGVKQVYPGRYTPDGLLSLKRKESVTFSHCVPAILQMLLACPAAKETDFTGWKIVIGGSALPTSLAKAALDRGMDVFTGYGMSETCPVLTVAHLKTPAAGRDADIAIRAKSGLAVPFVTLRVVDEDMNDVPHDGRSTGEVVARAPWLTEGYLKDEAASDHLWAGGYLHTGDIGNIDADGYLQITDRMKDVIKSGGEWISSLALEDIILKHPSVSEAAVIGIADAKWGERPLALIVLKRDCPATMGSADILAHLNQCAKEGEISRLAIPERIICVEALERTSVGKLDKKTMRAKYGQPK